jgi:hypothetical protein
LEAILFHIFLLLHENTTFSVCFSTYNNLDFKSSYLHPLPLKKTITVKSSYCKKLYFSKTLLWFVCARASTAAPSSTGDSTAAPSYTGAPRPPWPSCPSRPPPLPCSRSIAIHPGFPTHSLLIETSEIVRALISFTCP